MTRTVAVLGAEHAPELAARAAAAFGGAPTDEQAVQRWAGRAAAGEVYGLVDDGRVLGHARMRLVPHWFGRRQVTCQHIASVAVPPEHRRRGVASELMRALARRSAAEGVGLSLLFPATTALYRGLGWEHAGRLQTWKLDARRAPATDEPMALVADEPSWAEIRACYDRWARAIPGAMVRTPEEWDALSGTQYRYLLRAADGAAAYALVDHDRRPDDWQYSLRIRDWAAVTARGLRALAGYVGGHGTLGKAATFRGPSPCPWALVVPEQDLEPVGGLNWMARGLDLSTAVAQRGFPAGLTVQVPLHVTDDVVTANTRAWMLSVRDGAGRLEDAAGIEPGAAVDVTARAVGPLYTGFMDPYTLAAAGLLRGPEPAVARLAAAFAGPPPALMDFF